jgi:hydrogenase-4 component B
MVSGMSFLALGCMALGLGAPVVARYLSHIITNTFNIPALPVAMGVWVYPDGAAQTILSTPFVAILLVGLLTVPWILVVMYGGNNAGERIVNDPWACGYGYSSKMSISAGSFDQPIASTFSGVYLLRSMTQKPLDSIAALSRRTRDGIAYMEPMLESLVKQPIIKTVDYLGRQIQALQMGDIRMYCLYIILTLAILLVVIFK